MGPPPSPCFLFLLVIRLVPAHVTVLQDVGLPTGETAKTIGIPFTGEHIEENLN